MQGDDCISSFLECPCVICNATAHY
jgi:hypothetical protein